MIYTKRKNIHRYLGQSSALDTAIHYLLSADLKALAKGRNEVDGDAVFINRFDYQTMSAEDAIWEGHIQYADMHILLSGHEKIGVSNAASLKQTVCNSEEDFVGFDGPVETWFTMTPEDVLIVYPEDIHKVKVVDSESTLVEKACFKIKV